MENTNFFFCFYSFGSENPMFDYKNGQNPLSKELRQPKHCAKYYASTGRKSKTQQQTSSIAIHGSSEIAVLSNNTGDIAIYLLLGIGMKPTNTIVPTEPSHLFA